MIVTPDIRAIPAEATRPLRQSVLRPTQAASELVYPGDDAASAGHFGAFVGERLVGVASVYAEARPGAASKNAWRLRGMAVAPGSQGQGLGAALFATTLEHARVHGGSTYWCNARTSARGFYEGLGMTQIGDEFELPEIGRHVVMEFTI